MAPSRIARILSRTAVGLLLLGVLTAVLALVLQRPPSAGAWSMPVDYRPGDRVAVVSSGLRSQSRPGTPLTDADLDLCVEKSVWSVFYNAGQDCCARSRILVQRGIHDKFVARLVARTRKFVVGHPENKGTQIGPIISARQHARIAGYLAAGKAEGAKLLCGGVRPRGGPAKG